MKAILRKGAVACAAMLMGANVMAQSFDFTKEFEGDYWPDVVYHSLMKDDVTRLLVTESTRNNSIEGIYESYYELNKLSILNNELATEKEFTSGPLFEEIEDVCVTSAPKTLKVASIDTVYSGTEAIDNFFCNFENFNDCSYSYYDVLEIHSDEESIIRYYVDDYIQRYHLGAMCDNQETTFEGARFIMPYGSYRKSDRFDWGKQYPTRGWIYKDYDEVYYVEINYIADELEEIGRQSAKASLYHMDSPSYNDYIAETDDYSAIISQCLFNDDDKYEFLLPELAVFETTGEDWNGNIVTTYAHKTIGYKIVSEEGATLHSLIINEERNPNTRCYAYVVNLGDKNYLMINYYTSGGEGYEVTRFYEIKKNASGTSIEKVREMRGSMNIRPTVANRDEEITITLNDENSNAARELIITGVNGQLVGRRDIPAGENTVTVSAAMMRSGMYNFTLQKKGEIMDNGKVIVK